MRRGRSRRGLDREHWPKVLGLSGRNKALRLTKVAGQLEFGAGKLSCRLSRG